MFYNILFIVIIFDISSWVQSIFHMFTNNPGGVFKLVLLIYLHSTLSVSIKLGVRIRGPQYCGSLYCVTQQIHGESNRSINLRQIIPGPRGRQLVQNTYTLPDNTLVTPSQSSGVHSAYKRTVGNYTYVNRIVYSSIIVYIF